MRNSSPARLDDGQPSTERGLVICRPAATEATPNHFRENVEILRLSPTRSIGIGSSHAGKRPRTPSGTLPARGIAHVVDFIEAHIDQDLNLSRLAKVAAMSVYHFARRFKETAGVSPHAYVVSRRVGRAQHMLQRGKSRLVDIATECGFSSQAHLTTVFRRELGVTPGAYRRAVCP